MTTPTQLVPLGKAQWTDGDGNPLVGGNVYFYVPGTTTPKTTWQDQGATTPNTNPVDLDARGEAIVWGTGTYRQMVYDVNGNLIYDVVTDTPMSAAALGNTTGAGGAALIGFDGTTLDQQFLSRVNRVVNSIAALRSLSHTTYTCAFATGYYAAHDGGGGAYQYDPSDTTSIDNGGTVIVAADGGRWKLQAVGPISVKQFGAKGDGATDDSTAFQNAVNALPANGGTIFVPDSANAYVVNTAPTFNSVSVLWDFGPNARITGTQTTFPGMVTNNGVIPVGPWTVSRSAVQATAGNGTAAFGVEWIQPSTLNGGGSGIYAGAQLNNAGANSIGLAANFVATANAGSSGNVWALELDIANFAGQGVGNQFGLSINGAGTYDVTFAMKTQMASSAHYLYGIDLQATIIGIFIENTSGHQNSLIAGTISQRYPGNTMQIGQLANSAGNSALLIQRITDTSPVGYLINAINASNTTVLFSVDVNGNLSAAGGFTFSPSTTTTAPSAGGAGALPATPAGYATMTIGGVQRKIAYY